MPDNRRDVAPLPATRPPELTRQRALGYDGAATGPFPPTIAPDVLTAVGLEPDLDALAPDSRDGGGAELRLFRS